MPFLGGVARGGYLGVPEKATAQQPTPTAGAEMVAGQGGDVGGSGGADGQKAAQEDFGRM